MNNPSVDRPPAADTFAALDLGSNSFHLMIARSQDNHLAVVDRHKEMVRLASGLQPDGTLSEAAMQRALNSLSRFAERLRGTPNANIRVVGTNTLRAAKNSDQFLQQAEAILGVPIDIISGIEEARLIFRGVVHDLSPNKEQRLVVDIGGGSSELIVGNMEPDELESLYMGCVSFTQRFFSNGHITRNAYLRAVLAARDETQPVAARYKAGHWQQAVGASGTIRAIEKILEGMDFNNEHGITRVGLDRLAEQVLQDGHIDRLNLPNLSEERRPVIVGGLAVLHGIFKELNIDRMLVSDYAIREGVILDLAGLNQNRDIRKDTVNRMMDFYHIDRMQAALVRNIAEHLFDQVIDDFGRQANPRRRLLGWAIDLHEAGLSIAHSGYNKHSAYILQNSDMPGFTKQEQKMLGFLTLNHRRKLRPMVDTYGFNPDWRLVQIMRLACLLCRRRSNEGIPPQLSIRFLEEGTLELTLPKTWLADHPMTEESLTTERTLWQRRNLDLHVITAKQREKHKKENAKNN